MSRPRLPWLIAVVALSMILVLAIAYLFRSPQAQPLRALSIVAPAEHSILESAISPDGSRVAFTLIDPSGKRQLCVRSLDSVQHRAIPGTDGASDPFWSPDGRYLGFFAQRKLQRISVDADTATAQVLADAPDGRGGAWSPGNVIIFAPNREDGLYRMPAAGGEVAPFTSLDRAGFENSHRWPQFLPDGRTVIFLARTSMTDKQGVYTATSSVVSENYYSAPRMPPSMQRVRGGSMLFADGDVLMSRPFDPRRLQFSGEAMPVTDLISIFQNRPHVSAASDGTLVYQVSERPAGTLTWHDRNGKSLGSLLKNTNEPYLRVSPDDRYAVTHRVDPRVGSGDIWILDLQRGTETRFTSNPAYEWMPVWSPDASRIAFASNRNGTMDLYVKPRKRLGKRATSCSPLPITKLLLTGRPTAAYWSLNRRARAKKRAIRPRFSMRNQSRSSSLIPNSTRSRASVSPDGRWLAYASNETGVYEVYVRTFAPAVTAALRSTRVSISGGSQPQWRPDGRELFYVSRSAHLVAVPINGRGTEFTAGRPKELFAFAIRSRGQPTPCYVMPSLATAHGSFSEKHPVTSRPRR